MKYHFFFLILLFVLTSCIEVGKPDITYLALGDSYTIGESVDPSQRWPIQLADELRRYGFDIKQPDILARTGWTTDELLAATDTARLNPPYDLVSILIGVNNQYRGLDTANYRKEMNKLMSVATEYAGGKPGKVFLVSIPDWGVTPFAQQLARDPKRIAHEINSFNRIKVELAAQNDAGREGNAGAR